MLVWGLSILAYILGALPFGLWVSYTQGVDLRLVASGNIGATNVFRALGLKWAVLVFTLDLIKGFIPTLLAVNLLPSPWAHVGIGLVAVVGHSFTIFAGFRGGKGVATGLGLLAALSPVIFSILLAYGLLVILVTKIVSVASISGSVLCVALFYFMGLPTAYLSVVSAICVVIIIRHYQNIGRLFKGTENKLNFKKESQA